MATFVRTTGGLLQLQDKQVSRADFQRIVEFARTVADTNVRTRVEQNNQVQPASPRVPQAAASRKSEPVDLQATTPTVFR